MNMNNKKIYTKISFVLGALLCASIALPVLAQTASDGTTPGATTQTTGNGQRMQRAKNRADQEIDRRVAALNKLATRVGAMKHITDTQKASLTTTIQTQISTLTTLKTKIDGDTDIATLRTDLQSITKSYRIFILIMPQITIMAAADRANTIADNMTTLSGKLSTRIATAEAAGKDVSTLKTTLDDMNTKIADAHTQAGIAITDVTSLVPDQGDATKAEANRQALLHARSKIRAAQDDLVGARKDALTISQGLKAFGDTTTTP